MIELSQLKVDSTSNQSDLIPYIADALRLLPEQIASYEILRRSIDARKKPQIFYVYHVAVQIKGSEKKLLAKRISGVLSYQKISYQTPEHGEIPLQKRPVVIGSGPAGLFAAYLLAQKGFEPLVIEQGMEMTKRKEAVERFWEDGTLNPNTNVQFGEGGAGTFSDGKLNTLKRDKVGRNHYVLETFVKFGAPDEILYDAKPHMGTDVMQDVIIRLRKEIIRLGGQFLFETKVTDFLLEGKTLKGVVTGNRAIATDLCILAIGHSARDTFRALYDQHVPMCAKEFAVGFRIEHPQEMMDVAQYGTQDASLGPATYKLATTATNARGVYSFCMCPGGYVVNSSSADKKLAINGMSYAARDTKNANSAIVVTVGKEEYSLSDPMSAISFQEDLEKRAYLLGNGKIPQQLFSDFVQKKASTTYGSFSSLTKGDSILTDLNPLLSDALRSSLLDGMHTFGTKIKGFDREDAIFSGIESRTSSPVRILRDESLESEISGLYPCGEGAGYAGGITSAAMDGLKVAEAILAKYKVCYE